MNSFINPNSTNLVYHIEIESLFVIDWTKSTNMVNRTINEKNRKITKRCTKRFH